MVMNSKIRKILAGIFFILITLLFLDFTGSIHTWFGWMAKIQFLPALLALNFVVIIALVLLTLLMGRIYCSVICPLGVLQDIFGWLGKKAKKNRYSYSKPLNVLRYVMLAVLVVALVAGFTSVAALIAPYSAFGRIASNLLSPIYLWGTTCSLLGPKVWIAMLSIVPRCGFVVALLWQYPSLLWSFFLYWLSETDVLIATLFVR
jgi:polyferredoxin